MMIGDSEKGPRVSPISRLAIQGLQILDRHLEDRLRWATGSKKRDQDRDRLIRFQSSTEASKPLGGFSK